MSQPEAQPEPELQLRSRLEEPDTKLWDLRDEMGVLLLARAAVMNTLKDMPPKEVV